MAYIIAEPCRGIGCAKRADVCIDDCIEVAALEDTYQIDPARCLDCGFCELVCPTQAIFPDYFIPEMWLNHIEKNRRTFHQGEPALATRQPSQLSGPVTMEETGFRRRTKSLRAWMGVGFRIAEEQVGGPSALVPNLFLDSCLLRDLLLVGRRVHNVGFFFLQLIRAHQEHRGDPGPQQLICYASHQDP